MALIKCPECGKEFANRTVICSNCGFQLVKKRREKRIVFIIIFIVLILIISIITMMFYKKQIVANKSITLLKNELTEFKDKLEVEKVVYNKGKNVCLIFYSIGSQQDTAMVNLDSNMIGLESVYSEISELLNKYSQDSSKTKDEIQKMAKRALEYPYDPFMAFGYFNSGEGWEVIKK